MFFLNINAPHYYMADLLVNGLWKNKKENETAMDCI